MGDPSRARELQPADLESFAARVRSLHGRRAASAAACQAALLLAVPAVVLAWFVAAWRLPIGVGVLGFALLVALLARQRARRIADTSLLRLAELDGGDQPQLLAEVGDELATWLELRRSPPSPMHAWLGRDVGAKLGRLTPRTVGELGRRRLGGSLWLLPLVLLLLLAWWLTNLLSPPWVGVLGGNANQPDAGGSGGGNGGGGGRGEGQGQSPQTGEAPPRDPHSEPAPPPPPPPPQSGAEPPPAEKPAPLLDLPTQQQFVVPEFVGDGPTRRARVHAAEVEQGAPAGAASQRTGDTTPSPVPPPAAERFERAAEAAAAARHVPPAEQPMVRRFFDALQKAAK